MVITAITMGRNGAADLLKMPFQTASIEMAKEGDELLIDNELRQGTPYGPFTIVIVGRTATNRITAPRHPDFLLLLLHAPR